MIVADQSSAFTSTRMKAWANKRRIALKGVSPGVHTGNSTAEFLVKLVKLSVKRRVLEQPLEKNDERDCWCNMITNSLFLNNTVRKKYQKDESEPPVWYSNTELMFWNQRRFLIQPLENSDTGLKPIDINNRAVLETRIRQNIKDQANLPNEPNFVVDDIVIIINKAGSSSLAKNKKHFSYKTFYRVLSLDGGSTAITPVLQDGTNSKSIFSIHSSNLKKFELGTLQKMLSDGVEEPQNFEDALDNKFVSRERL